MEDHFVGPDGLIRRSHPRPRPPAATGDGAEGAAPWAQRDAQTGRDEAASSPVDPIGHGWMNDVLRASRVLIVDDEESNLVVLEAILEDAGYDNVLCCSDATQTFDLYASFQPDVIMLDLHMSRMDGLGVLEGLNAVSGGDYLPVLIITGDSSQEARERALMAGARDFVAKPFTNNELLLRIKNLLETRQLYLTVRKQNQFLEDRIAQRAQELEDAKVEIIERLAKAAEFRDDETGKHTGRVGNLCARIGESLELPEAQIDLMRQAAPLHDVGKIGIPDRILQKPDRLSIDEFEIMKRHTAIGSSLLSGSVSRTLRLAQRIALTHHERWDGTGYEGIVGENIPLSGRIAAVADVYDALVHRRPYKEAWPADQALAEIEGQAGVQFDPAVVRAFLDLPEIIDLR
ncbi:MAG TPA: HD domain-containing phosphohydrolase [Actinomycetota bacterium]|nr:HD domain-containing phosphohydrolase [Actinomycetota bacterium]